MLVRSGGYFKSITFIVIVTIVAAVIIVLFFGCLSACCDHRAMLCVNTLFMAALCAGLVYLLIAISIPAHRPGKIESVVDSYYNSYTTSTESRKIVDDLQNYLKCCGSSSFGAKVTVNAKLRNSYPLSCCIQTDIQISKKVITSIYQLPGVNSVQSVVEFASNKTSDIIVDTTRNVLNTTLESTKRPDSILYADTDDTEIICRARDAKKTHNAGCSAKLREFEPYLYYGNMVLIALTGIAVLSGILACIECYPAGRGYSGRSFSRRRR